VKICVIPIESLTGTCELKLDGARSVLAPLVCKHVRCRRRLPLHTAMSQSLRFDVAERDHHLPKKEISTPWRYLRPSAKV
jgi:hypothetical protein